MSLTKQSGIAYIKKFIYLLEKGAGREKEKKRNINWLSLAHPQMGTWPTTQACALTRNRTCGLSVCRTTPNPLSRTSQDHVLKILEAHWLKIAALDLCRGCVPGQDALPPGCSPFSLGDPTLCFPWILEVSQLCRRQYQVDVDT